jgi:hypothetical protein
MVRKKGGKAAKSAACSSAPARFRPEEASSAVDAMGLKDQVGKIKSQKTKRPEMSLQDKVKKIDRQFFWLE